MPPTISIPIHLADADVFTCSSKDSKKYFHYFVTHFDLKGESSHVAKVVTNQP